MELIKNIVYAFLYVLLGIILITGWIISYALGYMLQGTWEGVLCIVANLVLGIFMIRLTRDKAREEKR